MYDKFELFPFSKKIKIKIKQYSSPVNLKCRIHRLHLCKGITSLLNECLGYDIKQSDGEALVILELWGMQSTISLPLLQSPFWHRVGAPDKPPIYGLIRIVWHLNQMQTNDLCQTELFEIELFDHLTLCKQMIDV